MLVNGEKGRKMVLENFIFLMAVHTVAILKMVLQKVKADSFILMVTFILENGKTIRPMVMGHITQLTEESMKDNGNSI